MILSPAVHYTCIIYICVFLDNERNMFFLIFIILYLFSCSGASVRTRVSSRIHSAAVNTETVESGAVRGQPRDVLNHVASKRAAEDIESSRGDVDDDVNSNYGSETEMDLGTVNVSEEVRRMGVELVKKLEKAQDTFAEKIALKIGHWEQKSAIPAICPRFNHEYNRKSYEWAAACKVYLLDVQYFLSQGNIEDAQSVIREHFLAVDSHLQQIKAADQASAGL